MVKCRDMQSGLSHQGKKSDCFQGNGFTAGIRTGDDQQFKILTELDVDRYDFLFIEKRMSSFFDEDTAFLVEIRLCAIHRAGELCSGKNKIQFCQKIQVITQSFGFFTTSGT